MNFNKNYWLLICYKKRKKLNIEIIRIYHSNNTKAMVYFYGKNSIKRKESELIYN